MANVIKFRKVMSDYLVGTMPFHDVIRELDKIISDNCGDILALQLERCGTCSFKMMNKEKLSYMNMEDLMYAKVEINREILERLRKRGGEKSE